MFESLMGVPFWTGALVVVLATGVYTAFGGLRAVLYTDLLQLIVLLGGAVAVTLVALAEVGGWRVMAETAGPQFMSMWRPASDPDFPWTGIVNFLHFAGLLFAFCSALLALVSLATSAEPAAKLRGLTLGTVEGEARGELTPRATIAGLLSLLGVLLAVAAVWTAFR